MKRFRNWMMGAIVISQMFALGFGLNIEKPDEGVFKKGIQHDNVKVIQQALKIAGTYKEVDTTNYYGVKTEAAVIRFQQIYGLDSDGVAGDKTLDKLLEYGYWPQLHEDIYKKDMVHKDILLIQAALHTTGHLKTTEFTEVFDEFTYDAVKDFQNAYGLEPDGIVGGETINKMLDLKVIVSGVTDTVLPASNTLVNQTVSRGTSQRSGEYIAWSEVHQMLDVGTEIRIQDYYTGITFNAMVGHGSNHADIEPLTLEDTAKMKAAWGGEFSWARRPVLVFYKNRVFAASLNGMPHAGLDSKPALEVVSNRSAGYGRGMNYDLVKGNGMDGHICLHFKGSKLHSNNKMDSKHQQAVRIAAGLE